MDVGLDAFGVDLLLRSGPVSAGFDMWPPVHWRPRLVEVL